MKVQEITLKNFRNIEFTAFSPERDINFLIGSNGQGKTSILEALSFLSSLRSFRDSSLSNLIRWSENMSLISCELSSHHLSHSSDPSVRKSKLQVCFQSMDPLGQKVTKKAFSNGKSFFSSTHYLTQRHGPFQTGFHTVIFNPSDHDLVRGDPSIRRNFLDRSLAAENLEYLQNLKKYQRALIQRNVLIKTIKRGGRISEEALEGFTESLCKLAAQLVQKRLEWIQRITDPLRQSFHRIAPNVPQLRIVYRSLWVPSIPLLTMNNELNSSLHFTGQGSLPSLKVLEQAFLKKIKELGSSEKQVGYSLVGSHRDDWTFFLGEKVLKGHGSQGEIRSALLALKLAEIQLFREMTGSRPLFLLDDFSSELDGERRSFLMDFLIETDLQTFVTTTEDLPFVGKRWCVVKGMIKEGKA